MRVKVISNPTNASGSRPARASTLAAEWVNGGDLRCVRSRGGQLTNIISWPRPHAARPPGDPTRLAGFSLPILATGAILIAVIKLSSQPLFIDFFTMWTGGRMSWTELHHIYDMARVDQAQAWLLGADAHDRPFPYPPTTLLVFAPLGLLPIWVASALWMIPIVAAFSWAAISLVPRERWLAAALILLAPPTVWAAISGQCVFLTGALAICGVRSLERRPVLAGILLGLAAAFKPTVLLMAPVAMMAGGHWRSLIAAGLAGLAMMALSVLFWGVQPWLAWFAYAPNYLATITANHAYVLGIVAPTGLAARLGLDGDLLLLWRCAFALMGGLATVLVFRRTKALWPRLTALFAASVLATPYAMNYEMALILPGAVLALITARTLRSQILALAAYWGLAFAGLPSVGSYSIFIFLVFAGACALSEAGLDRLPITEPEPEPVLAEAA